MASDSRTRPSAARAAATAGVFAAAVAAVAAIGSLAASSSADQYAMLQRPFWAPPSWLFGPVWTVLYLLIAFAGWKVWFATGPPGSLRRSMVWYGIGLVLNAAWTPLFFAAEARVAAFVVILLLDVVIAVTITVFWCRDRLAASLLIPYLAWTLFATFLNGAVIVLN